MDRFYTEVTKDTRLVGETIHRLRELNTKLLGQAYNKKGYLYSDCLAQAETRIAELEIEMNACKAETKILRQQYTKTVKSSDTRMRGLIDTDSLFNKKLEVYKNNLGLIKGDTVWGSPDGNRWDIGKFVNKLDSRYVIFIPENNDVSLCDFISTTSPYELKYNLTAREALVAIGQDKVVVDAEGRYYRWHDKFGLQVYLTSYGHCNGLDPDATYAIVKEYNSCGSGGIDEIV